MSEYVKHDESQRWLFFAVLAIPCFGVSAVISFLAATHYAWAAVTPTKAFPHQEAQFYADAWGAVFVTSVALIVILLASIIYVNWRTPKRPTNAPE